MLSFHNDQAVKDKYVDRVLAHQKADNIIRGTGWDGHKGCAVGCTLETYKHKQYEVELGIPEWLARVEDTLFEGMTKEKAYAWPARFLTAIPVGIPEDIFEKKVKAPFLVIVLKSTLESFDNNKFPDVTAAINGSISLWQSDGRGLAAGAAEAAAEAAGAAARAAGAAARAAAWAAEAAARAAAWAAEAAGAARAAAWAAEAAGAARAAGAAARAAAWAAEAAAWAAARAAGAEKMDYFADELIRLFESIE